LRCRTQCESTQRARNANPGGDRAVGITFGNFRMCIYTRVSHTGFVTEVRWHLAPFHLLQRICVRKTIGIGIGIPPPLTVPLPAQRAPPPSLRRGPRRARWESSAPRPRPDPWCHGEGGRGSPDRQPSGAVGASCGAMEGSPRASPPPRWPAARRLPRARGWRGGR